MKKLILFAIILALVLSGCAISAAETPDDASSEPVTAPASGSEADGESGDKTVPLLISPRPASGKTEAAEKLNHLGIMKGAPLPDGTIDYMLDEKLSREAALVLIVRALGHDDAEDEAYPVSPFSDVDSWAEGAVNYAYARGITKGVSSEKLGAEYPITVNEYSTMLLRALGFEGDFYFGEAYEFALEKGVISTVDGDSITRGDAARAILALLGGSVKGSEEPIAETLLETGKVSSEALDSVGMGAIVESADETLLSAGEVLEANSDKLFLLSVYDKAGALMRTVHGVNIGEYISVAAYDDIYGAARLTITAADGAEYEVIGINGYDEQAGIVSLSYEITEPNAHFSAPVEAQSDLVYILSSVASSEDYLGSFPYSVRAARPVVDARGSFIGLTQNGSMSVLTDFSWDKTYSFLSDFGRAHWPEMLYPRGLDPTKKMIAITFDDGPSRSLTPKFLDLLEQYGAVATFFECGNMLKANPQFLERMEELGCEIGNHTYSHPNLNKLSQQKVIAQIADTDAIIEEKLGHKATLVRAPYGNSNEKVREVIDRPLIYWTIDTLDWQSRNADAVFNKIVNGSFDGAIILMHSIHEPTYRACVKAIPWLIDNGYQLVTVSEMAECRGYELENGTVYYSFKQK